jgi:hypothetical protein
VQVINQLHHNVGEEPAHIEAVEQLDNIEQDLEVFRVEGHFEED